MKKYTLFPLMLLCLALVLSACGPKPSPAPGAALSPSAYPAGPQARTAYPASATAPSASLVTPETPAPAAPLPIPLSAIRMFPDGQGWASNQTQTALYHSADGGLTWKEVSPSAELAGANGGFYSFYLDGSSAWLSVGRMEKSTLLHSSDGGQTWRSFTTAAVLCSPFSPWAPPPSMLQFTAQLTAAKPGSSASDTNPAERIPRFRPAVSRTA